MDSEEKKELGFWEFCDKHVTSVTIMGVALCYMVAKIFGGRD
jgi:hypothetical protein